MFPTPRVPPMKHARLLALPLCLVFAGALRAGDVKQSYPPPAEVRAAFLKLLDRPRVEPDVKTHSSTVKDGMEIIQESFASERKADGTVERVPVLLVRPIGLKKRLPAVIVLHGTGGNKEGQMGWLTDLAKRGIIGVAIDARYHGERARGMKGAAAYNAAIVRAWKAKP